MNTVKLPLQPKRGVSGVWIEDGNGTTLFDANPLLLAEQPEQIFNTALMMAGGPELYTVCQQALAEIGVIGQVTDATVQRLSELLENMTRQ